MKKIIMLCLLSFFFLHGSAFSAFNFIGNGDGTVTDARTGLVWLKNANPGGAMNWNDAEAYCKSCKRAGRINRWLNRRSMASSE